MRWQLERGVLAGPRASRPGSPWWRAVNERLLRDTCDAGVLADSRPGEPSSPRVEHWQPHGLPWADSPPSAEHSAIRAWA